MKRLAIVFTIGLAACGSDSEPSPDAGAPAIDATVDGLAPDAGAPGSDAAGPMCTAAAEQLLGPIDRVSMGEVTVLADREGARTIFVDATAGGTQAASTNPRLYLSLETALRVDVTDKTAATSPAWDLAIKRPILFTNGGDGGAGQGGSVFLAGRDFASVTANDVATATFARESFFEADCTPKLDLTGAVQTTFDEWYDYDQTTNGVSPKAGTWLVQGGTGKVYKVRILSYYTTPDGGVGMSGGRYTLQIGALQ